MEEPEPPQPMSTGSVPDRAARRDALAALADASADATWADEHEQTSGGAAPLPAVLGVLAGDVGPKGRISARLRSLSRSERERYGEVPYGTAIPGGGRHLLALVVIVVGSCAAGVLLLGWLTR